MDLMNKLWKSALTLIIAGSSFLPMKNYAQKQSTQVDSSLISKPVVFNFNVTDRSNGQGLEGVGINPKTPDGTHFGEYYITQGAIYTDENGNAWKDMALPMWDKITGIDDLFGKGVVPDKFYVNAYPNPFNPSTNVVFYAEKRGNYMYQLVDGDGSLIAKGEKELTPGSYSFPVNTGAAGVDFLRIIGPDGSIGRVKLMNLGGGYAPKVGDIGGCGTDLSAKNQSMKSASNNSNSNVGRVSKSTVSGEPVDTVQVSYGKSGYPGEVFYGVPLYGVEHPDTAVVKSEEGVGFIQNVFIPGVENELVDTVDTYFASVESLDNFWDNTKHIGRVLIYNTPGGYPADSLDFKLKIAPAGFTGTSTPSMNEIERPDMKYSIDNNNLENKLNSIRQRYDNIQR